MRLRSALAVAGLGAMLSSSPALAEPAFAVRTGHRCSECHVNRSGGGMRTAFGSLYTQTILPAHELRWGDRGYFLPADPDARFGVGTDLRFQAVAVNHRDADDSFSFEIPEANVYAEVRLVPDLFSLYLDETVGPGGAGARELFGLYAFGRGNTYLKLGKFLPPYGFRLPDDDAFIRQYSGFTYSAPDIGLELGAEPERWSLHLAAVNGTSGGSEDNRSKQFSFLAVRRFDAFRIGLAGANNIAQGGRTTETGILGGANFGRLALLGEVDWRELEATGTTTHSVLGLVEADLLVRRGLNLKLARDYIDPDLDVRTDPRIRDTLAVEYIPYPFVQCRLVLQRRDGPPQVAGSRDGQALLELHLFF